jgi:hypothetical protein
MLAAGIMRHARGEIRTAGVGFAVDPQPRQQAARMDAAAGVMAKIAITAGGAPRYQ